MKRQVRTHKFNGIKYYVGIDEPYIGWCDRPVTPDPKEYPAIRLPNGLAFGNGRKAKSDLQVLLHECCHAENWKLSEEEVDGIATDISSLLWRLGYRRNEQIMAVTNKSCPACGKDKLITEFNKSKVRKDGHDWKCRQCKKSYYQENKEKINKKSKIDYQQNKDHYKNIFLKTKYGISLDEYNEKFQEQNGCCAICGRHQSTLIKTLGVDHDHISKEIRSLLCQKCNFLLGNADENIHVLLSAVEYLEFWSK